MIWGIDTPFLIEVEVEEHAHHEKAYQLFQERLEHGDRFAVTPQVLDEFIHVVTDSKRFDRPLTIGRATECAQEWWFGKEVVQVFPNMQSQQLFYAWMQRYSLERKRILDIKLAAIYYANGIRSLLTSHVRDYSVLGSFEVVQTRSSDS